MNKYSLATCRNPAIAGKGPYRTVTELAESVGISPGSLGKLLMREPDAPVFIRKHRGSRWYNLWEFEKWWKAYNGTPEERLKAIEKKIVNELARSTTL